jgi:tetratricopeptide (TPR) repeat protein
VIRYQQNRHGEALPLIEKAIALNPKSTAYHKNLGSALQGLGRTEAPTATTRRRCVSTRAITRPITASLNAIDRATTMPPPWRPIGRPSKSRPTSSIR